MTVGFLLSLIRPVSAHALRLNVRPTSSKRSDAQEHTARINPPTDTRCVLHGAVTYVPLPRSYVTAPLPFLTLNDD